MRNRCKWGPLNAVWMLVIIWGGMVGASTAADRGQVLDADSGAAIKDAVAVVWWTRQIEMGTPRARPECIAIRAVAVDGMGAFELPMLQVPGSIMSDLSVQRHVYAFKVGYREHPRSYDPEALQTRMFYLQPDDFPVEMRMNYLISVLAKLECPRQTERKVVLKTLFRSLYGEARGLRLGNHDKQQRKLEQVERRIAYSWSDELGRQPREIMARYFRETVASELVE